MSSPENRDSGLIERAKEAGKFLLEPITFTLLLRERMGENFRIQHILPVVFPVLVGVATSLRFGPVEGVSLGVASWIIMAGTCKQIRST